ncbi:hypothetical protein H4582DRAFT_198223 [Lactarius indigo]|nr:hypothetical protein H4582DRAFT_198223 [Lactarius indigo]
MSCSIAILVALCILRAPGTADIVIRSNPENLIIRTEAVSGNPGLWGSTFAFNTWRPPDKSWSHDRVHTTIMPNRIDTPLAVFKLSPSSHDGKVSYPFWISK